MRISENHWSSLTEENNNEAQREEVTSGQGDTDSSCKKDREPKGTGFPAQSPLKLKWFHASGKRMV